MSKTRDPRDGADRDVSEEERVEVERVRVERDDPGAPGVPPPRAVPPPGSGLPGAPDAVLVEEGRTRVVSEEERIRALDDGSVERRAVRQEHDPPRQTAVVDGRGWWIAAVLAVIALAIAAIAFGAWYLTQDDEVAVPDVVGLSVDEAVARLDDDGLDSELARGPSDEPVDTVFDQSPAAGTSVDDGSTVEISVSEGPQEVEVPNAIGVTEAEARDRLAQAGLDVNVVEVFSDDSEGTVIAQNPSAGESVEPDTVVRLNVSKGEGTVVVPSLVGQQREAAEQRLADLGLEANVVPVPSGEAEGLVVAQNPTSGQVQVGSTVRLNVSAGS